MRAAIFSAALSLAILAWLVLRLPNLTP